MPFDRLDWYISEGGREGLRRLQGFKPRDAASAASKAVAMASELQAFLVPPPDRHDREWGALVRRLARQALRRLEPRLTAPTSHG